MPEPPTTTLGLFDSSRSLTQIDPAHPWRAALSGWLESVHLVVAVGLCTLVALFLADLHAALAPPEADDAVEAAIVVLLGVLLGELVLSAVVHPAFCLRAHFWFDLVGALALLVDLAMVQAAITGRPPGLQACATGDRRSFMFFSAYIYILLCVYIYTYVYEYCCVLCTYRWRRDCGVPQDASTVLEGPLRGTSTAATQAIEATQQLRLFCILRLYRYDAVLLSSLVKAHT